MKKKLLNQNQKCLRCNDLDYWSANPANNFTLKNRLFGATNMVKKQ